MSKLFIVTGASRGIGASIAVKLSKLGYSLALVSRKEDDLKAVKAQCQISENQKIEIFPYDLTDIKGIESLVDNIHNKFGNIYGIIHNAGRFCKGKSYDCDIEFWDRGLDINLRSVMYLNRFVLPYMIEKEAGGAVITISSVAGKSSFAGAANYCMTKFGLLGYMGSVFEEVRDFGIKVSTICPGYVNTAMVGADNVDRDKMIQPDDVADMVEYILSCSHTICPVEMTIRPQQNVYT